MRIRICASAWRKRNGLCVGPLSKARAAGTQATSEIRALPLRRQQRVTRAPEEGAIPAGAPSTLRALARLLRLRPESGLGMAPPLRLVVPSATSIAEQRKHGGPCRIIQPGSPCFFEAPFDLLWMTISKRKGNEWSVRIAGMSATAPASVRDAARSWRSLSLWPLAPLVSSHRQARYCNPRAF